MTNALSSHVDFISQFTLKCTMTHAELTWTERIHWPQLTYLALCHILGCIGLLYLPSCQYGTILMAILFYWLGGLGITAGAHRLWSHRSYKAHDSVRFLLMICQSIANQGTILHWSRDHRVHHKYSDTASDPHNSERGFFYSHIGWLVTKKDPRVVEAGRKLNFDDLYQDWVVMLQQKYNPYGQLLLCFALPTWMTMYLCNETFLHALLIPGFLRYMVLLHATWLVNSAAHFFGYRKYDESIPPRENHLVALLALGEGWHNYHHKFPYDYATSEYGILRQSNPTKFFIDLLAHFNLVWDRKRATQVWERMKDTRKKSQCMDENHSVAYSERKAKSN